MCLATGVNGMWPSCGPPPARQRPGAVSAGLDERGGVAMTARSVRNRRRRRRRPGGSARRGSSLNRCALDEPRLPFSLR